MSANEKKWTKALSVYKYADNTRGSFELILTASLFFAAWTGTWLALQYNVWLGLLATIVPAVFLVRIFAIQHDCGHQALFSAKPVNDWIGRALGVLTFTPYDVWKHAHAIHHAGSGNLDRRDLGEITTLTVEEYQSRSLLGRLAYRIYRNPITLFVIGPAYMFLLQHRLPIGMMKKGLVPWLSTQLTNLAILAIALLMIWLVGWADFLLIQIPVVAIGASIGVWLFFVQHQFEETHWSRSDIWQRENAALHGSSYYDLPKPIMWLTGNIGIHHVHHVAANIPFHRLPQTLKDYPELKEIGRLTLWQSIKCVPLSLWDEQRKELISFRQFRKQFAA